MAKATQLKIESILAEMGEVGHLLHHMGAAEGAAGNISVGIRDPLEFHHLFPNEEQIQLPDPVPGLAGMTFIATGSGCRMRDMEKYPAANLGCIIVDDGGTTARLFTADDRQFMRMTSEFNSHLIVHDDWMSGGDLKFHTILHAQPLYITYLSHMERYQDETYFNHHLMRWEPETILQFPHGFGVCEYKVPASRGIQDVTVKAMRDHTLTMWCKHGLMVRSDVSVMQAFDRIEYAETAARYEYFNLTLNEPSSGLSVGEILEVCKQFKIEQTVFQKK